MTETMRRELPVELTETEMTEKAMELGRLVLEIDAEEESAKAEAKERRESIAALETRMRRLARVLRDRRELRLVVVEKRILIDLQRIEYFRVDTLEVISSRDATPDELQLDLPIEDAASEEAEAPTAERKKKRAV